MFSRSHRETIISAAVLCLHAGAGWHTQPCQVSTSTDHSTTTLASLRLARQRSSYCTALLIGSLLTVKPVALYSIQSDVPTSPAEPLRFSHQVPKLPKELRSAQQVCFSSDSSKLFASSSHSSVVVTSLDQLECKYIHTLKPKSG